MTSTSSSRTTFASQALSTGLPIVSVGAEQAYIQSLNSGTWRVPRCIGCERWVFYPRVLCPFCGSREFHWEMPSGLGTIYSTTVMRRSPQAGGSLNLCLVDLDEGFRMMSRVQGVAPEVPSIGARVRAFVDREGEQALVLFRLEGTGR